MTDSFLGVGVSLCCVSAWCLVVTHLSSWRFDPASSISRIDARPRRRQPTGVHAAGCSLHTQGETTKKNLKGLSNIAARAAVTLTFLTMSTVVRAAGFALMEQSASGQGSAFAGAAALTEDATVIYFNPAGMTQLSGGQAVIGANIIDLNAAFTNRGSSFSSAAGGGALTGVDDDGGKTVVVPNAYFSSALNERWSLGIGFNAPFGLETDFADTWVGRYHGIKSELTTINVY